MSRLTNGENLVAQPLVFVSHSEKNEAEKDVLMTHLGVLANAALIDLWSDDRIQAGMDWETELLEALSHAEVAVLLITANFLTSSFIVEKGIPTLLRRRQDEGLILVPIIAKACAWQQIEWLARMAVRPRHRLPVWRDGGIHVDEELAAIADEVAGILVRIPSHPISNAQGVKDSPKPVALDPISLAKELLECKSVEDQASRESIVGSLPAYIRQRIHRDSQSLTDVSNIVQAVLDYDDGLNHLIEAIRAYEGPSRAMERVNTFLARTK